MPTTSSASLSVEAPADGEGPDRNSYPVHIGRVNTARRIYLCSQAGTGSLDGTSTTRFASNPAYAGWSTEATCLLSLGAAPLVAAGGESSDYPLPSTAPCCGMLPRECPLIPLFR